MSAAALRFAAINCIFIADGFPENKRAYIEAASFVMGGDRDIRMSSSCFIVAKAAAMPAKLTKKKNLI